MIRITALLLTSLLATPVLAQSQAERISTTTGRLIGGSAGCGISSDRLTRISSEVSNVSRDAATSPADLDRARAASEAAAAQLADAVRIETQACPAAQTASEGLERACLPGDAVSCRAGIDALR